MTSFEGSKISSVHTQNGFSQSLDEELDRLLKSCIENVMTSPEDNFAMTQNLKVVHHLKQLNRILLESTPPEHNHENETAIGERRKTRAEKRGQEIEQTMKCILQGLSNQGTVKKRVRMCFFLGGGAQFPKRMHISLELTAIKKMAAVHLPTMHCGPKLL